MSRPWTLEGLAAVRVLAAANAPLKHIGYAVNRTAGEVDFALWALVGRSPEQAIGRLNQGEWNLADRILLELALDVLTAPQLAARLGVAESIVSDQLRILADAELVDADDPPPPASRREMRWWAPGRAQA